MLEVYLQPMDQGVVDPHPELLFLRSGGTLLYASALGYLTDPGDVAAARYAPLSVSVEAGPCFLAPNPSPGGTNLLTMCEQVAIAQLQVGSPDDDTRLLDEFEKDQIVAGDNTYNIQTLQLRRARDCGGFEDLTWFGHALALASAP